jgi:hypothetical protein
MRRPRCAAVPPLGAAGHVPGEVAGRLALWPHLSIKQCVACVCKVVGVAGAFAPCARRSSPFALRGCPTSVPPRPSRRPRPAPLPTTQLSKHLTEALVSDWHVRAAGRRRALRCLRCCACPAEDPYCCTHRPSLTSRCADSCHSLASHPARTLLAKAAGRLGPRGAAIVRPSLISGAAVQLCTSGCSRCGPRARMGLLSFCYLRKPLQLQGERTRAYRGRKKERKAYARCQACVKGAPASRSHRATVGA